MPYTKTPSRRNATVDVYMSKLSYKWKCLSIIFYILIYLSKNETESFEEDL